MFIAKIVSRLSLAFVLAGLSASVAKADTLTFDTSGSGPGFQVVLSQTDTNHVLVTVSLINGATNFVHSGDTNHPGFAFNLANDPSNIVISFPSGSAWDSTDVHLTPPVTTNGPPLGTFDYFIDNPGHGGSANNAGPLVFTVNDPDGISVYDFSSNGKDEGAYFFAADIGADGTTGEQGINSPGTPGDTPPAVPEPSSLALFGTGILGAAGLIRRRLSA